MLEAQIVNETNLKPQSFRQRGLVKEGMKVFRGFGFFPDKNLAGDTTQVPSSV